MELALLKACHNSIIHILTLPDSHPLHQIAQKAKCNPPAKHPSPINSLIKRFELHNTKIETIYPDANIKRTNIRYKTVVASTRKESIAMEARDDADYKIFSDGSGQENGIGSAAILYRKGRISQVETLQKYLGTPKPTK